MKKITFFIALLTVSLGFSQNLVTNGDFETVYAGEWTGNGTGQTRVDDGTGNFVNQAILSAANEVWQTTLQQLIPLTNGTSYDMSFDAYVVGNPTKDIIAGIGQNSGSFENNQITASLTNTSQNFSTTFVVDWDDSCCGTRVFFDLDGAGDTGWEIYIDNVSVTESTLGVEDYQLIDIRTYPNPTRDSRTVKTKKEIMSSIQ
ncbi:MAG: hypothetical protein HKN40_11880, partial [Winogradskyella sp.]|uniref:carbohydrate binding domain-containing protein n=1 Tax=Winogradskyella sp. TaxID=1883156 RepID=UPI00181E4EDA|nr:hypothetical protein [Winogradskyella sp.]